MLSIKHYTLQNGLASSAFGSGKFDAQFQSIGSCHTCNLETTEGQIIKPPILIKDNTCNQEGPLLSKNQSYVQL